MNNTITLKDALAVMNSRDLDGKKKAFSISFYTADRKTQQAGKLISLENVVMCGAKINLNHHKMIQVRPKHNSQHPYPIHTILIMSFNGKQVNL